MNYGIFIIIPWNVVSFMANLFISLVKCSLHVFTINGIIRKINMTGYRCFITICHENVMKINYKV